MSSPDLSVARQMIDRAIDRNPGHFADTEAMAEGIAGKLCGIPPDVRVEQSPVEGAVRVFTPDGPVDVPTADIQRMLEVSEPVAALAAILALRPVRIQGEW